MDKPEVSPEGRKDIRRHLRSSLKQGRKITRPQPKGRAGTKIGPRYLTKLEDLIELRKEFDSLEDGRKALGYQSRQALACVFTNAGKILSRTKLQDGTALTPGQQRVIRNILLSPDPLVALCRFLVGGAEPHRRLMPAVVMSLFFEIDLDEIVSHWKDKAYVQD